MLEDGDLLHLRLGGYGIYNLKSANGDEAVPRVLLTLQMEVEQIMKVGGAGWGGGLERTSGGQRAATGGREFAVQTRWRPLRVAVHTTADGG